ncbi:MAG: DUF167 domain-containing protein [Elusimicrobia bacterium]|nr:DUF167 domain-containing protein [Elusimicrobiota bacterium]
MPKGPGPVGPPRAETFIKVKVHPDSSRDRVERKAPDAYELWVKAPPEQGRANAAVLALLAREPPLAGRRLRIVKGLTSPSKIVSVF